MAERAFNVRSHIKIPKPLSGKLPNENAVSHVQLWDDYCRVVGWAAPADDAADNRVTNFCLSLCDEAREWYNTLPNNINYDGMKDAFKARFGNTPPASVDLLLLASAKKSADESYQEFGCRIQKQAQRLNMADQAFQFFLMGLDPQIGAYIMSRNLNNIPAAVTAAEGISGYLKTTQPTPPPAPATPTPEVHFAMTTAMTDNAETMEAVRDSIETLAESQRQMAESLMAFNARYQKGKTDSRRGRSNSTSSSRSSSRSSRSSGPAEKKKSKATKDDKCFICGNKGHWARECKTFKQVHAMMEIFAASSEDEEEEGDDQTSDP